VASGASLEVDETRTLLDTSTEVEARSGDRVTPLEHVSALGRVLDGLGLPWVLGGSLASSLVGEPHSTVDIDVAVLLAEHHVASLVDAVLAEVEPRDDRA
jgi:hypothetical protein